jgi:hypothetical protein
MEPATTSTRKTVRWYDFGGSLAWVALLCVVLVVDWITAHKETILDVYRVASEHFIERQPLYALEAAMGYLYLPAFVVLYAPFYALGANFGDLLWRVLGFGVLSYAAFRQVQAIDDQRPVWLLSAGLLMALPLCAGSVRNGQANILLAGACWLLVLVALERRRLGTLVWSMIAVIAKPTAIITLLLVGAVRPRLVGVLVLAIALVLALPYAFAPPDYVTGLNRDFFALLGEMSLDRSSLFTPADFTAPFRALGIEIPTGMAAAIRTIAALPTLTAILWFAHRGERRTAGLAISVVATYYMCVFNPRVEGETYALLAVPFGLSISLMYRREGATYPSLALGALLFVSGFSGVETHIHKLIDHWFQPTVCTVIFAGIFRWFWTRTAAPQAIPAVVEASG